MLPSFVHQLNAHVFSSGFEYPDWVMSRALFEQVRMLAGFDGSRNHHDLDDLEAALSKQFSVIEQKHYILQFHVRAAVTRCFHFDSKKMQFYQKHA